MPDDPNHIADRLVAHAAFLRRLASACATEKQAEQILQLERECDGRSSIDLRAAESDAVPRAGMR